MYPIRIIIILVALLLLGGCAWTPSVHGYVAVDSYYDPGYRGCGYHNRFNHFRCYRGGYRNHYRGGHRHYYGNRVRGGQPFLTPRNNHYRRGRHNHRGGHHQINQPRSFSTPGARSGGGGGRGSHGSHGGGGGNRHFRTPQ